MGRVWVAGILKANVYYYLAILWLELANRMLALFVGRGA